ncbi:hypothetical protein IFT84_10390 [Rhizobium sp. CFBP 8762]|uniref:DUF4376 domain-containing protein n=1 Tax=Rhizobium sp. CFBP 8762 TaxID=2775279 RepID=UPI0017852120|nr:hypothetical protein [Rhizobium sp. CFBP 8762]MBD8554932.1 hypothetical protein [Rhizobium sp. CFBP 8762]
MTIISLGIFSRYKPTKENSTWQADFPQGLFYRNEEGKCWNDLIKELAEYDNGGAMIGAAKHPHYATVHQGIVFYTDSDPSKLAPYDMEVLASTEPIGVGLAWNGSSLSRVPVKAADVTLERDKRIAAGVRVMIGTIGAIPVQGREKDQTNLLALKDNARDLVAAGIKKPVMTFRDANDVVHLLTPAQMMELVSKGLAWVSQVYQASWIIKEMNPIPHDFASNAALWPADNI